MSGQDANSKDMLSRIHEQRVKDQNNDSTQTGAFHGQGQEANLT